MDDVFSTSVTMLGRSWAQLQHLSLIDVFPVINQLENCLLGPGMLLLELVLDAESFNRSRDIPTCFGGRVILDRFLDFLTAPTVCPQLTVLQLSPIRSTDGVLSTLLATRNRSLRRFTYSIIDGLPHEVDMDALNLLSSVTVPLI